MHRILLFFIDGLGLGPDTIDNPLASGALPDFEGLLGARLVEPDFEEAVAMPSGERLVARLDAVLGVEGIPQSGTGQTSIYSGKNAQELAGRHVPALPSRRLRELLEADSLFHLREPGTHRPTVAFANAYTSTYLGRLGDGGRRMSAAVSAARAAGLRLRDENDLERGRALSWDLTGEHFGVPLPALRVGARGARWQGFERPAVTRVLPEIAAIRLLGISAEHRLTVFETYLADLAGHGRFVIEPAEALQRLDAFLGTLVRRRPRDVTIVVTSDHGNLEVLGSAQHTRNEVPLIVFGPAAPCFGGALRLFDVRWRIERALGLEARPVPAETHG